jgi:hypothetical protein
MVYVYVCFDACMCRFIWRHKHVYVCRYGICTYVCRYVLSALYMYVSLEDDWIDQQMQPPALWKLPPTKSVQKCAKSHAISLCETAQRVISSEGSGEGDGLRRAERRGTGEEGLGIGVMRETVRVSCIDECLRACVLACLRMRVCVCAPARVAH